MAVLSLAAAALLTLISCGTAGEEGGDYEIEKLYGRGTGVQFLVRVSSSKITTSEELVLSLQTRAAEDWSVSFPSIPENLGEFKVVERSPETRNLDRDSNLISTRTYRLEPSLPGEYVIPPLEISFGDRTGSYPFSLSSEEIAIEVVSVLPPQLGEQDIEEIAGPLTLPRSILFWAGIAAAVAAAGGAAGILTFRRRSIRRRYAADPVDRREDWEIALDELEEMMKADLVGQGRYREFYVGISDLTRRYLERHFGIRAPELTTEEFLSKARGHATLANHRRGLEDFLFHCDLVKFSRHTPDQEEIDRTVAACRTFITETSPAAAEQQRR
jgi:hypothetical protein